MRKRTAVVALVVGAFAVLAVGSYATADSGKKNVDAGTMSGYLEGAPGGPISTAATGSFEATINATSIEYTLEYSGLESDVAQAHIHFGHRSTNGGISAWLCGTTGRCRPAGTPACAGARAERSRARSRRLTWSGRPRRESSQVSSQSSSQRCVRGRRTRTSIRRRSAVARFAARSTTTTSETTRSHEARGQAPA